MLESLDHDSVAAAMGLVRTHPDPGLTQREASAHHVAWLLADESIPVQDATASAAAWSEAAAGPELESCLRNDVMPGIQGSDHARLALCYTSLAACKEAQEGPGSGKALLGHAGVLSKCARLSPTLDYKLLLQANAAIASQEEVVTAMQHLERIVSKGNVAYLTKLLAKIKKLAQVGLEGTPQGHLYAILILREVTAAVEGGTGRGLTPEDVGIAGLGYHDLLFLVRRLVCVPDQGSSIASLVRLKLVDGALMAEEVEGIKPRSGALGLWKSHLVTIIKLESKASASMEPGLVEQVSVLDEAGPDPSRRIAALTHLIARGGSVSRLFSVVKSGYDLNAGGERAKGGAEKALCGVYKMAVQMLIEGAMKGEEAAIEGLRACLCGIQQEQESIGTTLAASLRPSLEVCFEHSATPWQVEQMATSFIDGVPL